MKEEPNTTDTQPWWKEPWPWILMAGPFITLIGCAVTIVLAVHYYGDQPIHDGGQRKGLVVQKVQESVPVERDSTAPTTQKVPSDRRQQP